MLELQNISWKTPEGKEVLKNINITIDNNCLVAISGHNGSGKTTLAKIIAGIEKPTSGRIIFNGEDITNLSIAERARRGISLGFQQPVSFKGFTIRKLLTLASGYYHFYDEHFFKKILMSVGLCANTYLDRELDNTLSGGEMKRIEIATILARNTDFMLFDEPEAGIDLWSFNNLIKVFEDLMQEQNKTIIIISHQEKLLQTADKIILLNEGEVSDFGPSSEILQKIKSDENIVKHCCGRLEVK